MYIAETEAMVSYIASKAENKEYFGKDLQEIVRVRQFLGVLNLNDMKLDTFKIFYNQDRATATNEVFADSSKASLKLNELNDYLEGREFYVIGVTFADVIVAYTTEYVCAL